MFCLQNHCESWVAGSPFQSAYTDLQSLAARASQWVSIANKAPNQIQQTSTRTVWDRKYLKFCIPTKTTKSTLVDVEPLPRLSQYSRLIFGMMDLKVGSGGIHSFQLHFSSKCGLSQQTWSIVFIPEKESGISERVLPIHDACKWTRKPRMTGQPLPTNSGFFTKYSSNTAAGKSYSQAIRVSFAAFIKSQSIRLA